MAVRKTIWKVVNNKENPENFDVLYHIHRGNGEPVIYADKDEGMYNLETKENVLTEEVFLGKEYPIENIIISVEAFSNVKIKKLEIPAGVTKIPNLCFQAAKIKTLKLPSTLHGTIGTGAFMYAETDTLEIPARVTKIPVYCFEGAKIKTLKLSSKLEIGAFFGAEIGTLEILAGVTEIPNGCFEGAKIKTLKLSTIFEIGESAFFRAEIGTLEIPARVIKIPALCFQGAKIKTLKLSNALKTIGESAFFRAEIGTLEIPAGETEIPALCFQGVKIKTLKLSNALKTIGESAFFKSEIESLYIKNVSSIGEEAFKGFQGTIFTDNSESKAKFVKAGLNKKQFVDLSSREERFEVLKDKTLPEIRKLENDLNIDLWDKDYMRSVEENSFLGLPNEATSIMFKHLTLFQLDQIKKDKGFSNNSKNESNYGSNKSKVNVTKEVSIFNPLLDNENKGPKKTNNDLANKPK